MAELHLKDRPEILDAILAKFSGIKWMIHRQATSDSVQTYMEREWACKAARFAGEAVLQFEYDTDAVNFILTRPWEDPLKLSE